MKIILAILIVVASCLYASAQVFYKQKFALTNGGPTKDLTEYLPERLIATNGNAVGLKLNGVDLQTTLDTLSSGSHGGTVTNVTVPSYLLSTGAGGATIALTDAPDSFIPGWSTIETNAMLNTLNGTATNPILKGAQLTDTVTLNGSNLNTLFAHSFTTGTGVTNDGNVLSGSYTAGVNVTFTPGANGSVTISAGAGGGTGSVTSVNATVPSYLVVSGVPITTSGTIAISDTPGSHLSEWSAVSTNSFTASTNGNSTNLTEIGNASVVGVNAPSNTNIVIVAPYDTAATGAGNIGPTTGQTAYEWLGYAHQYRIRQNGTIVQVKINTGLLTGVTGIFVKIWRKDGTTYDLIATSANILSSVTASTLNTVAVSLDGVQEGDFIGGRITYSSASVQVVTSKSVSNATTYSVLNTTPSASDYAWESQTASAGVIVPIECYMVAPYIVSIGDSIMSGRTDHIAFDDSFADTTSIPSQMVYKFGRGTGYTYQNMGISGNTTANIETRFTADVVNSKPVSVLTEGGVNDILGASSAATILGHYTNILSAAQTAGIVPIVSGIMPFRTYAGGGASDAASRIADTVNATLAVIAPLYGGRFADVSSMGIFYPSGDVGNLWKLNPIYDSGDGIHPSTAGHAKWAELMLQGMVQQTVKGGSLSGTLQVNGDIYMSGNGPRYIRVDRTTNYNAAGSGLTISPGGSVGGIANLDGGDMVIESGISTGTGASKVSIRVPFLGTSGTTDNTPTEAFRIESITTAGARYGRLISSTDDSVLRFYAGASGTTYEGGVGYDAALGAVGFYSLVNGDNPRFYVKADDSIGAIPTTFTIAGTATAGKFKVIAGQDSRDQDSSIAKLYNTTTKGLWFGYNTTSGVGLIGAINEGTSHDPLVFAPKGGNIGFGIDAAVPLDFIHFKTNGDLFIRGEGGATANVFYRMYNGLIYMGGVGVQGSTGRIGFADQNNGTSPKLYIQSSDQSGGFTGTNSFTFSSGTGPKVRIFGGSDTVDQFTQQLMVGKDSTYFGWMGYNQSADEFRIGSVHNGTAHTPIYLSPLGGGIKVGTAGGFSVTHGGILTVTGETNTSLTASRVIASDANKQEISSTLTLAEANALHGFTPTTAMVSSGTFATNTVPRSTDATGTNFGPSAISSGSAGGITSINGTVNIATFLNVNGAGQSVAGLNTTRFSAATDASIGYAGAPDASSVLELRSTAKGVLIPRMTTTQRDAIVSPLTGLVIYNTSLTTPDFFNGTNWQSVLIPNNSGNVGIGTTNPAAKLDVSGSIASTSLNTAALTNSSLTASRAIVTDANKKEVSSAATATEVGYLSGVTSAIQTQLNSKQTQGPSLDGINALTGFGILALDADTGSPFLRTLTAGSGISISNGDGLSGNPTISATSGTLPSQTGNAGKLLVTDGTNAAWANTITNNTITIFDPTTGGTGFATLNLSVPDVGLDVNIGSEVPGVSDFAIQNNTSGANLSLSVNPGVGGEKAIVLSGSTLETDFPGDIVMVPGAAIQIQHGTNQRAGNAVLVAGTVTVANTSVTANTVAIPVCKTPGGTQGFLSYSLDPGVGFTINSSSGSDTSTVSYLLIENP